MWFRLTMFLLVLSALLLLVAAGSFYYSNVEKKIMVDIEKKMNIHLQTASEFLSTFISENVKTSKALAEMEPIKNVLTEVNELNLKAAINVLNIFRNTYEVDMCYVIDRNGIAITSSETEASNFFVGNNYTFRPYFQKAIKGEPYVYMCLGFTTKKRGVYYSQPVFDTESQKPIGVVVTKNKINSIETKISHALTGNWILGDPNGMIFASNIKDWRIKLMWELDKISQQKIAASKQFGDYPWEHINITKQGNDRVVDQYNQCYFIKETSLYNFPDWKIYYLSNIQTAFEYLSDPLLEFRVPIILLSSLSIGCFILILYVVATTEYNKKKKLQEALQKKNGYLLSLHETTLGLIQRLNMDELIENILYRAGSLTGTSHGFLLLHDNKSDHLVLKVGFGRFVSIIGMKMSVNDGLSGGVFQTGRSRAIANYSNWQDRIDHPFFQEMKSIISVALKRQNVTVGVMGLAHFDSYQVFESDEMEILEKFAHLASVAYDNANLYTELQLELKERKSAEKKLEKLNIELERLAVVDGLTQLANRRKFDKHLKTEWRRMTREKMPLSIVLCDVDYFKQYNDYYGHLAGDDCLRKIGKVLANHIKRSGDLAARYGGEEFGIILANTPIEGAYQLTREICKAVQDLNIEHKKSTVSTFVTISAGISCMIPDNNTPTELIVENADKALYEAKSNGRNQAFMFNV